MANRHEETLHATSHQTNASGNDNKTSPRTCQSDTIDQSTATPVGDDVEKREPSCLSLIHISEPTRPY